MLQWFYRQGDTELGPVSESELLLLRSENRIDSRTPVRSVESSNWTTLAKLLKPQLISDSRNFQSQPVSVRPLRDIDKAGDLALESTALRAFPPPIPVEADDEQKARRRFTTIGVGGIAGVMLWLLLVWLLWPASSGSSGGGASGDGYAEHDGGGGAAAEKDSKLPSNESGNAVLLKEESSVAAAKSEGKHSGAEDAADGDKTRQDTNTPVVPDAAVAESSGAAEGNQTMEGHQLEEDPMRDGALRTNRDPSEGEVPNVRFAVTAPGEATFFGIRSSGRRFVFVVDCSGSMATGRLSRAQDELIACLERMPASVRFTIIFFDDSLQTYTRLSDKETMTRATSDEVDAAKHWVRKVACGGGTDVQMGMSAALGVRPAADVVFLLTDGQFDPATPAVVRAANSEKARINTIAFETRDGELMLKEIAKDSGGDYKFVP